MPLFKPTSVNAELRQHRSPSEVDFPDVDDDERHRGLALTPAPRATVPSWYRGLHQSLRALSQSGMDLDQLEHDSAENGDEILGKCCSVIVVSTTVSLETSRGQFQLS